MGKITGLSGDNVESALTRQLALLAALTLLVCATGAAVTQYEIGSIPDQTAYQGMVRTFQITAPTLGADVTFAIEIAVPPQGSISLDPATGVFRYGSGPADRRPFSVSFSATDGVSTLSQDVMVTSVPSLMPEADIIEYVRSVPAENEQPPLVVEENRPEVIRWNHRDFPPAGVIHPKETAISGQTVVFDRDQGSLYTLFSERDDLTKLTISAETVVIREALRWMGTAVEINCQSLRFEDVEGRDPACIITTPAPWLSGTTPLPANAKIEIDSNYAETLRTPAEPGAKGLPAGNVTLNILELASVDANGDDAPPTVKRFILTGGKGQQPGLGYPGPNGKSKNTFVTISGYLDWPRMIDVGPGVTALYEMEREMAFCIPGIPIHHWQPSQEGWNDWHPGNGFNAEPAGIPGDGGDGGSFYTPDLAWAVFLESAGGAPGDTGAVAPGGAPGQPVPARRVSGWWLDDVTPTYEQDLVTAAYGVGANTDNAGGDFGGHETDCIWDIVMGGLMAVPGVNESYSASPGADGVPQTSTNEMALPGEAFQIDPDLTWATSGVLRNVLAGIKDLYLNGHVEEAREKLAFYMAMLEDMEQDDDLRQIREEMEVLHHRACNNLDYFGNPAGWVPMLSFESNLTAFQNEIERGIRVLYLTYWLTEVADETTDKVNAFVAARTVLKQELDDYIAKYEEAAALIPGLEVQAVNITNDSELLTERLKQIEAKLMYQAQDNLKPPFWKGPMKIAGAALKMVPVYQPVVGAIGDGLGILADIDPNTPWESIGQIVGLAATTTNTMMTDRSTELGKEIEKLKKSTGAGRTSTTSTDTSALDDKTKLKENIDAVKGAASIVAQGIGPLSTAIKGTQVPESKIKAEFEKLRAASPAFENVVKDMKTLLSEKTKYAEQLAAVSQDLTDASTGITQTLLALHATADYIAQNADRIDERAQMYLKEMKRRAQDRLLKYQYYMAKAFEYRMLREYSGNLDLNAMFDRFLNMAAAPDGILDEQRFDSLKELYLEELLRLTAEIFDELNANAPERSVPITFALTQRELDQLNNDGYVYINMKTRNLFGNTEENLRIVDLRTDDIAVHPEAGRSYGPTAIMRLRFEHSGNSLLSSRGSIYRFTHYRTSDVNPISWKTVYDGITGTWEETTISAASQSLLRFLMEDELGHVNPDMMLYSRPAAWADILITKEQVTSTGAKMIVDNLRIQVQYDYFEKRLDQSELEIVTNDDLMPLLFLGGSGGLAADINGRADGLGNFTRVYNRGQGITLEAPAVYGTWAFRGWEDASGLTAKSLADTGALDVTLSEHKRLKAVYMNLADTTAPAPPVITTNGGSSFTTGFDTVPLVGTTDPDTAFVRVNGVDIPYEAGAAVWQTDVTLSLGAQSFSVVALDEELNESGPDVITVSWVPAYDTDGDGMTDVEESREDTDGDGIPNYLDSDADGDAMSDAWEHDHGLDPFSPDGDADLDGDGVPNVMEFLHNTDPKDPMSKPAPADLDVAPTQIVLSAASPDATVEVTNLGECTLHWTAESDNAGILISPLSGSGPAMLSISTSVLDQNFSAVVTIRNTADSADVGSVSVNVIRAPMPANLDVSTNMILLTELAPTAAFNVLNSGELPLTWVIEAGSGPVAVHPISGDAPAEITVTGWNFTRDVTCILTLRNADNQNDAEVILLQLRRTPVPGDLEVSTNLLLLTEAAPLATFNILNLGEASISWAIASDSQGIIVAPAFGTGAATISVLGTDFAESATANLMVANAEDAEDAESVVVHLRQTPVPGNLDVSTNLVTLTESAPTTTVNVLNHGKTPIAWEAASDHHAVVVTPAWGADAGEITIGATDFSQNATANVLVENAENPLDREIIVVQVQQTPAPGDLDVSASLLVLTASTPFAVFNVMNLGGLPLGWTIAADNDAVQFDPHSGTDAAAVTVLAEAFVEDTTTVLTVSNAGDPADTASVLVRVRHTALPANLAVSTNTLVLTDLAPSATVTVSNRGELPLQWEATCDHRAIDIDPAWGNGEADITIQGLEFMADDTANITIVNSDNPQDQETIVVTLERTQLLPPGCRPAEANSGDAGHASLAGPLVALGILSFMAALRPRKR